VRARMRWMEVCACVHTHMRARRRTRTKRTLNARFTAHTAVLQRSRTGRPSGAGGSAPNRCADGLLTAFTKLRSAQ
jgi:hypothetical protein